MVSLLPTKFHEILFSSFRGVVLTNCVTDRQDKNNVWLIQINLTYAVWPFSLTKIVSIVIKDGIYGKLSQKVTCNSICQFSDWIESKLQHHYSMLYNNYIYVSLHFCGETLFLSCLSYIFVQRYTKKSIE
jgi:hypothetical protein